ncbi:MAG TPA: FAD-dependent monooxygenase [Gemmatimonadaceae bacterium]
MATETSILIVGGSLNGLSLALLLAQHGVRCLVVERHAATTVQYKFSGISPRSMEIYRSLGIEDEIRANRTGDQAAGAIARARNLSDPDIEWMMASAWPDTSDISPTAAATCDQDRLEPILRAHAERRGADIRFHTELVDFEQDAREVRARIRHLGTGDEESVVADYMVGADGAHGSIRDALGIARHGPGPLQHWMNLIFETDLEPFLAGRRFTSCFVTDVNGSILPREDPDRWMLAVPYVPERGERPEQFDAAYCRELVRRAAGRHDVRADLVDARQWEVAGYVADRYRDGRVFLVGDSAHVIPPTGGFSGNTGIHDAHNLAWKLAAVVHGRASASLLDSYDRERRPVAEATLAQALARLAAWFKDPTKRLPPAVPIVDDYRVVFGYVYPSGAFVADASVPSARLAQGIFEDPRAPSSRPGARAQHVVLDDDGSPLSTLDLFGSGFVLLAGSRGASWCEAVRRMASSQLDIHCHRIAPDGDLHDVAGRWNALYGVRDDGAVLVRPDGYIAWRSPSAANDPEAMLTEVLSRIGMRADGSRGQRAHP